VKKPDVRKIFRLFNTLHQATAPVPCFVACVARELETSCWAPQVRTLRFWQDILPHIGQRDTNTTATSPEMFGGQGPDFLRGVAISEHQIFRFAKMILCDRRSTSYDLASIFRGRRNTLEAWTGKIARRCGTRPSAQNCFVFDVVKFKNWGSLAELLRFGCCQVQKLRKSRRIAVFSILQLDRQTGRQTDR